MSSTQKRSKTTKTKYPHSFTNPKISAASDDLLAMGGVLYSKENEEIGFIYTLVAPADYTDEASQIIGTLEFNPEEIADE